MNNKFESIYNETRQTPYPMQHFYHNVNQFNNDNLLNIEEIRRSTLRIGDEGDEVRTLQEYLIALNYLSGIPDGFFGQNTERAVRNFQTDYKLVVDGIVGSSTWDALTRALNEPIPVGRPTIKVGDQNFYVKEAQLKLTTLGYFFGNPDGIFDEETEEAVKRFQKDLNLTVDGVVGPNTWRAINRAFAATEVKLPELRPTVSLGARGNDIVLLHTMLRALNYFPYKISDVFDTNTEEAVRAFQNNSGLPVTGVVDQSTWELLEQAILMPGSRELREGTTGPSVIILQEKLKLTGNYFGSITGSFGPETTEAVKAFQTSIGLFPTGIVDDETWEILYLDTEELALKVPISVTDRPTLRLGSTGPAVSDLQTLLKQLGFYDGPINGNFDNATNIAVRTFQTNNRLTADGVVGQKTWSALVYLYSPLAACGVTGPTEPTDFKGVVVDAGHGGSDPGAVSKDIIEKEYTLKISQYMANRFRELGIPFAMTRTTDETLSNIERVRRMKEPFGDVANAIVISNHINAGGGEGAEVIYALRNNANLANAILTEIGNAGQKKRNVYQRTLPSDPTKDYYYIMRDTDNLQTTLVEYGFLDNAADVLRLQKNWDKFAEGTVKAVAEYMGYKYTAPETGKATYIVQPGDTLWSIANRFNTTVDEIKRLNNLTSNTISVGQQLFISGAGITPTPPSGNVVYVVKAGDTLWSIANRFDTTVAEIRRLNNLTSDSLSIGQQLFVPGVSIEIPGTSPTVYTVQLGDTLYSIARKFNTTVANLRSWNNLTSDVLSIGQRLIVAQSGTPQYTIHTVVSGDSLWSIANRFNTTVDAIKRLNNLTSNLLSIGQQLKIPTS